MNMRRARFIGRDIYDWLRENYRILIAVIIAIVLLGLLVQVVIPGLPNVFDFAIFILVWLKDRVIDFCRLIWPTFGDKEFWGLLIIVAFIRAGFTGIAHSIENGLGKLADAIKNSK